jgi:hypothetical protein
MMATSACSSSAISTGGLGCPIIVADATRFSRNSEEATKLMSGLRPLWIIDVSLGWNPELAAVMMGRITRGQIEAEEIGSRTRNALSRVKAVGAILGNRSILADAQRRGAETNRALAQQRDAQIELVQAEPLAQGVTSATEIAKAVNSAGVSPPRGGQWTENDLRRPLKRIHNRRSANQAGTVPDIVGTTSRPDPNEASEPRPQHTPSIAIRHLGPVSSCALSEIPS